MFIKETVVRSFLKTFADFLAAIKLFFARLSDYADEPSTFMRDKFQILECAKYTSFEV